MQNIHLVNWHVRFYVCYISSIFFYFQWDFDERNFFYNKGTVTGLELAITYFECGFTLKYIRDMIITYRTFIGFAKFSPSARLYLEAFVTMTARLNLKTEGIDSLLWFFYFSFLYSSVFFLWKMTSYLSHAISPYLHGKLINWTSAFYLSFCYTVLPRILNLFE